GAPGTTGANVGQDLAKFSKHDTSESANIANPIPDNVTCVDCHEPHTMKSTVAAAPNIEGNFGSVSGVTAAGAGITAARFEFETCYKCHGDQRAVQPAISRQIAQANTRLEFDPAAISSHPVEAPGKGRDVPSLRTTLTTASVIYCTDCHSSSSGKTAGGSGPSGPHGSSYPWLLVANYQTTDKTSESATAYALCYRCHDRSSILGNQSFSSHKKHIVDLKTPCSVCHDAHGISSAQ